MIGTRGSGITPARIHRTQTWRFVLRVLALTALLDQWSASAGSSFAEPPSGYSLVWSEEFNEGIDATPDPSTWNYDLGGGGWGNGEWQIYVNSWANSHIVADADATDGQALRIRVERDGRGNFYSARINTAGKVSFQYGYIEARMKLPYSQGMWPAFWMLGTNIGSAHWPGCGEIDIMENIGSRTGTNWGSLHGPGYSGGRAINATYNLPPGGSFADDYHTFAILWLPDFIQYSVDGNVYETRTPSDTHGNPWVFNHPFFFILNCAVGGTFPGNPDGTTITPMNCYIDYIRVYKPDIPAGSIISLQAHVNGNYVCADNAGNDPLIANRPAANTWEKYEVVDMGNGLVALRALANGLYVSADNVGNSPLIANRAAVGTWEMFEWVDFGNNNVALKAVVNGKYICADNWGNDPLIANRTVVGGWETFTYTIY